MHTSSIFGMDIGSNIFNAYLYKLSNLILSSKCNSKTKGANYVMLYNVFADHSPDYGYELHCLAKLKKTL